MVADLLPSIRRLSVLLLPFFLALVCSSCASYKVQTIEFLGPPPPCFAPVDDRNEGEEYFEGDGEIYENIKTALEHPLYRIIPRHRCQIRWYDIGHWMTWMLFGNDDDGIFGEEPTANYHIYRPNTGCKALSWAIRNPLHNFCFYVIGTANCRNSELTILSITSNQFCLFRYRPVATTVFAGRGSSLYIALHGWKPFISSRLCYGPEAKSEFYLGWRCRGNFGVKYIPFTRHH